MLVAHEGTLTRLALAHNQIIMTDDSERLAIIVRGETLAMMHLNADCTWLEREDAACGVYGSHQVTMGGDTRHDLTSDVACDHDQPARDRFRAPLFLGRYCHVALLLSHGEIGVRVAFCSAQDATSTTERWCWLDTEPPSDCFALPLLS